MEANESQDDVAHATVDAGATLAANSCSEEFRRSLLLCSRTK